MANNHFIYDRTKPLGKLVAEMVQHVRDAAANANRIQAIMNEMGASAIAGAVLETGNADGAATFGVAAGQGNAFYVAHTTVRDNLNAIAQDKLGDLDLGG